MNPGAALLQEWQLTVDGPTRPSGQPVRTAGGGPALLVLGASEHAHLALQRWQGNGAVRLMRADPRRGALLVERAYAESLTGLWDVEACEIAAGLYAALHVPALPQLRRLSSLVAKWTPHLATLPRNAPVPHRLVDRALSIGRAFEADPDTDGRLLHGDLRYRHVLAADRAPWLAVAPRPLSGDPHYEPVPMLIDQWTDVVASGEVRNAVRRRFHALVDTAGLDEDRARDWAVLRLAVLAVEAAQAGDQELLTRAITVAKAVQD